MEGELLWPLDDNVLALGIPAYHMVVLWALEKPRTRSMLKKLTDAKDEETNA